jgi:CYTH domain-containing protein
MMPPSKYAQVERERRFLLNQFPKNPPILRTRQITDHYIENTTLRLREQREDGAPNIYKLTQKLPAVANGAQQGFITSMFLTADEFSVFAELPSKVLCKTRFSIPPFGVDRFAGTLAGLLMAEAEFDSAAAAQALVLPPWNSKEVSNDIRFTGGNLVHSSPGDIQTWALEYGVKIAFA